MEVNYTSGEKTLIRLEEVDQGKTVLVNGKGSVKVVTGMSLNDKGVTRVLLVALETGDPQFWYGGTLVAPVEAVMTIKE